MSDQQHLFINRHRTVSIEGTDEVSAVYISGKKVDFDIDADEDLKKYKDRKRDYALLQMREGYSKFLSKQFKNIIVFTGAGSSIGVGEGQKGLSMSGLWTEVEKLLSPELLKQICEDVKYANYSSDRNIEVLLSKINSIVNLFREDLEMRYDLYGEKRNLEDVMRIIQKEITRLCTLSAPEDDSVFPHKLFLEKLLKRKSTLPRLKIFTANYDKLFEQAANRLGAVVIDGFTFTYPRIFSGRNFDYDIVQREKSRIKDEDNFIPRLFHLYKVHGSIDWEKSNEEIRVNENPASSLMVFPKDAKYENSYEQPFFEMIARFQQCIRQGDTLLITIGFSYGDKHLVTIINEAINQNPGFQLMVVNPNFDDGKNDRFATLKKVALASDRVIMVSEAFMDFSINLPEMKTYDDEHENVVKIDLNKFSK